MCLKGVSLRCFGELNFRKFGSWFSTRGLRGPTWPGCLIESSFPDSRADLTEREHDGRVFALWFTLMREDAG